jgi:hypothetical protein
MLQAETQGASDEHDGEQRDSTGRKDQRSERHQCPARKTDTKTHGE